jgi:hypothetical protein
VKKQIFKSGVVLFTGALCSLSTGAEIQFTKYQVDPTFVSEGVAIADINKDGRTDIIAGDYWYETVKLGEWRRHPFRQPRDRYDGANDGRYDGTKGYSNSFADFAEDLNGDGWVDAIIVEFPGEPFHWYENPRGESGLWKEHEIWRSACNETPIFTDLFGDGKRGVVLGYQPEGQMGYFRPGADPTKVWEPLAISAPKSPGTVRFWHGLGVGDVNQDGRNDVIINVGWWEQPAGRKAGPWKFHPLALDPPKRAPSDPTREDPACADIYVYDVDGDGDNDFISSSAHKYGVWWFEQVAGDGEPKFVPHVIKDDVSQSHALHLVDMNGDGIKDLVTGKRYFAHQGGDPGEYEPAVLYWLELQRVSGKPKFIMHQIDDNSGHGTQFVVDDFNGDRLPDVVTSNKKGTHVFIQKRS